MLPAVEELLELSPPYEIFEFPEAQDVLFYVTRFELGRIEITPRFPGAPPRKVVRAIRLHTTPEFKLYAPYYWDATPSRLVAGLLPLLEAGEHKKAYVVVRRTVAGPRARFGIRLIPFEQITREEALKMAAKLGW